MPGYALEAAFARSQEAFAETEEWLDGPQAAGLEHWQLEEELSVRGRELQRRLLQDYLDLRAARERRRDQLAGADGIARTRAERGRSRLLSTVFGQVRVSRIAYRAPGTANVHLADGIARTRAERGRSRLLSTVFGQVRVSRIAYRAPGAANVHLADAELGLPRGRHSHGLCRLAAAAAARGSFAQACADVSARTGSRLGRRQCEELARRAARDFGGFYAGTAHRPQPGAAPGDVLALSCDGKGIVVLPQAMRPDAARQARKAVPRQDGRLSRGQVRNRKRTAEAGAVFDLAPVPRTAAAILGPGPGPQAPRAANKWVTASITSTAAAVVASVFAEADRRDPARQRTWIALADGNKHQIARIRAEAGARGVTITIICDFIHVLEYLWDAAWCFFPEASPDAAPWVRARAADILAGRAPQTAAAIRGQAAAIPGLSAAKRKAAARTAGYLDAKAPFLDYPRALAAGWPISTGVIEGTCRHLVKDRMDITGARWGLQTAEAILQLRALHANGDFDDYWKYHIQQEHQRNHPSHTLAA